MKVSAIGKNIRALREAKDLSQSQVAEDADMSFRAYQSIEYGESEPKAPTILKIAKALQVSVDEIFGLSPMTAPPATVAAMTPDQLIETLQKATQSETADEAELLRLFRSASPTLKIAILETVRNLFPKKK